MPVITQTVVELISQLLPGRVLVAVGGSPAHGRYEHPGGLMKSRYVALAEKLFLWFKSMRFGTVECKGVLRVSLSVLARSFDWYRWYYALIGALLKRILPHQVAAAAVTKMIASVSYANRSDPGTACR